jgi:hypothetical protein
LAGLHRTPAKTRAALTQALVRCGSDALVRDPADGGIGKDLAGAVQECAQPILSMGAQRDVRRVGLLEHIGRASLQAAGRRPLVAVDWTEWRSGPSVPSAAVCVDIQGDSGLCASLLQDRHPAQSEHSGKHVRASTDAPVARDEVPPVAGFDRGFRRVSLIRELHWLTST